MNINDFVILPGSKPGNSARLKAKTVRELQLEKVQLETENAEMEKKLRQLQSNMRREKEERKKSSAYHWRSGQAAMAIQTQLLSQSKAKNNKGSSGKVKLHMLKEQTQEPVKKTFKHEMANAVAPEKSEVKGMAHGLCEIKSALMAEADIRVGKLKVIDRFIKEVNVNETKINHEQKQVNSKLQVISDKFSSLPASVGGAEDLSSESTCTGLENQDKGLLLNGTFNEKESAKSFQEALLQWRKGNRDHREQLFAREVLSEPVGICEVQTNLTVTKEPIQMEFKNDGLCYMEKLLLKKYRRTPIDQISGGCVKDLRSLQTVSVPEAVTGGGGEDDDDDDDVGDLTVEDVRRYWTSVFGEQVPKTVSESAEPSLKIEFLDDPFGKDLEESSNILVMEAEAVGMNKQGKAEPLEQFGRYQKYRDYLEEKRELSQSFLPFPLDRNPISSKEISQEEIIVSSPERNAMQQKSIKLKTMRQSLSSCKLPQKKTSEDSQKLGSISNSESLALPVVTESSMLQNVATRQKCVSAQYWGLEGFFIVGTNPKKVILEVHSSLCAGSSPADCTILFPGDGKWVSETSLSQYADDSVVQGVLEGNDFERLRSRNTLPCKLPGSCPTSTQPRPKSSLTCVFGVDAETLEHKCLDVTKQEEEYLWERMADQEALLTLERELQSYTGPEKCYSLTSDDVTSSSRHSEKICRNTMDFHKNLELKHHSRVDTPRDWDESQMDDEEEILEDKQQVLALQ